MPFTLQAHKPCSERLSLNPCLVCVSQHQMSLISLGVRLAVEGTTRCPGHQLMCAICLSGIGSDSSLCCKKCWGLNYMKKNLVEMSAMELALDNSLCHMQNYTQESMWACGCKGCIQRVLLLQQMKAMEEGISHQIEREEPDHIELLMFPEILVE
jgi:hypothetical protein